MRYKRKTIEGMIVISFIILLVLIIVLYVYANNINTINSKNIKKQNIWIPPIPSNVDY